MTIYINPGSGPVRGATRENAEANMVVFIHDLVSGGHAKEVGIVSVIDAPESDGRWTYLIIADGQEREIEMPGWPIEQVRWMDQPEQNIWDFPRLYVDGSSWVWLYALNNCEAYEPDDEVSK